MKKLSCSKQNIGSRGPSLGRIATFNKDENNFIKEYSISNLNKDN
jgi:hypothetical protein